MFRNSAVALSVTDRVKTRSPQYFSSKFGVARVPRRRDRGPDGPKRGLKPRATSGTVVSVMDSRSRSSGNIESSASVAGFTRA